MLFKSNLAVAGFAALSSAILLPPSIASEPTDTVTTLPFDAVANVDGKVISLPCVGCPVQAGRTAEGVVFMAGVDNELQLDFQVNHLKQSDVLTLNGVQLFPIDPEFNAEPLKAAQIITATEFDKISIPEPVSVGLGYESRINLIKAADDKEPLSLYNVRIQVVEVNGQFIDGLEAVEMKLIATPAGGLMIADIVKIPTTNAALAPGAECTTLLCTLKGIAAGKIPYFKPKMKGPKGMGKPCGGKVKGMPGDRPRLGGKPHGADKFRAHGHGPHRHRHHNKLHRFLHAMKNIALQVLIPVTIGIACGMTASFIGMIVGHTIVFLWRKLYRRGQKGQCVKLQAETLKDEKVMLLSEEEEALPAYKDEEEVAVTEKTVAL